MGVSKVYDCKACNARLLNVISLMTTDQIEMGDLWIAGTMVGMPHYPCPEVLEEPGVLYRRQKVSADGVVAQLAINVLVAGVE